MALFKKFEITEDDIAILNSIIPDNLKKEKYYISDFDKGGIHQQHKNYCESIRKEISKEINTLDKLKNSYNLALSEKIIIFTTEPYQSKPLGMIDIGVVVKFGSASSGNRFENGLIGYAIEGALDKTWAESNAQYQEVQKAKVKLLEKTRDVYPTCNLLFKFEIDFREIGSSGNVFIYMRATACEGKNDLLDRFKIDLDNQIEELQKGIPQKQKNLKEMMSYLTKIPSSQKELKDLLRR